jgi:hypothetical protein
MEFSCNATPFFFVRMDQLTPQRLAGFFGTLALTHLAPELLVRLNQFGCALLDQSFELLGAISQLLVRLTQVTLRALLFFQKIADLKLPTSGIQRYLYRT